MRGPAIDAWHSLQLLLVAAAADWAGVTVAAHTSVIESTRTARVRRVDVEAWFGLSPDPTCGRIDLSPSASFGIFDRRERLSDTLSLRERGG
jgi:hypothetical protein